MMGSVFSSSQTRNLIIFYCVIVGDYVFILSDEAIIISKNIWKTKLSKDLNLNDD